MPSDESGHNGNSLWQIRGWGTGIRVGGENTPTETSYPLKSPEEGRFFLEVLANHLAE